MIASIRPPCLVLDAAEVVERTADRRLTIPVEEQDHAARRGCATHVKGKELAERTLRIEKSELVSARAARVDILDPSRNHAIAEVAVGAKHHVVAVPGRLLDRRQVV